jgi:hypothetical protein
MVLHRLREAASQAAGRERGGGGQASRVAVIARDSSVGRWFAHGFVVPRHSSSATWKRLTTFGALRADAGDFVEQRVEKAGLVDAVGDPAGANCCYVCGTQTEGFKKPYFTCEPLFSDKDINIGARGRCYDSAMSYGRAPQYLETRRSNTIWQHVNFTAIEQ